tara:strand:+ start:1794 stop:2156 length:363 start_codon:yes stop_codon:yes gene_type:complete
MKMRERVVGGGRVYLSRGRRGEHFTVQIKSKSRCTQHAERGGNNQRRQSCHLTSSEFTKSKEKIKNQKPKKRREQDLGPSYLGALKFSGWLVFTPLALRIFNFQLFIGFCFSDIHSRFLF